MSRPNIDASTAQRSPASVCRPTRRGDTARCRRRGSSPEPTRVDVEALHISVGAGRQPCMERRAVNRGAPEPGTGGIYWFDRDGRWVPPSVTAVVNDSRRNRGAAFALGGQVAADRSNLADSRIDERSRWCSDPGRWRGRVPDRPWGTGIPVDGVAGVVVYPVGSGPGGDSIGGHRQAPPALVDEMVM